MISLNSYGYTKGTTVFCGQRIKVHVTSPGANPEIFIEGLGLTLSLYTFCFILKMT
jgi:hypothetical protein